MGAELAYRYAPSTGGRMTNPYLTVFNYLDGSVPNDFSLNVRGGYSFIPGLLVYGLIGFSETQFEYSFTDNDSVVRQFNRWQSGVNPGAGVEFALSNAFTLDCRYVYSLYGSRRTTVIESAYYGGIQTTGFYAQPSVQAVSLTANYHFG